MATLSRNRLTPNVRAINNAGAARSLAKPKDTLGDPIELPSVLTC